MPLTVLLKQVSPSVKLVGSPIALRTLFLAGDVWEVVLPNTAILLLFAGVLLGWAIRATRTSLA